MRIGWSHGRNGSRSSWMEKGVQKIDNGSGTGGSSENPWLFGTPSIRDLEVGGAGIPWCWEERRGEGLLWRDLRTMDTEQDSRSSLQSAPCMKLVAFFSKMHLRHPAVSRKCFPECLCLRASALHCWAGSPQPSPVLGLADLCYPLAMSLGFLVLQSSALGSHYGVRTHRVQRGKVTKKMNK